MKTVLESPRVAPGPSIRLLGGFSVVDEEGRLAVPSGGARLLAFLAVHGHPVRRAFASGVLWPDVTDARAAANLRSAIRRLRCLSPDLLSVGPTEVALGDRTVVDLDDIRAAAERLIDHGGDPRPPDLGLATVRALSEEMLPGWYEEWALVETDDWRQLRLHALEAMSRRLRENGRFAEAVVAASAAVRVEPLRESAQVVLIEALLSEGNGLDALRAYDTFARRLEKEFSSLPGSALSALVEHLNRPASP